jgi:arylsulfatase A-like enzyme
MRTAAFLFTLFVVTAKAAQPPHIVFFLADDYGFADVSYHGLQQNDTNVIATPNLDALAASGVKLENYYVQAVCSPTRANLFTGRYSIHHGIHWPLADSSPSALPLDEVTIAQKMKEAGYATHMVGKWHLGFKSWAHTPTERGFDTFLGYYAGSQDYFNKQSLCWPGNFNKQNGCFENTTSTGEPVTGIDFHRNREPIMNSTGYSTHEYTEEAVRIIKAHAANAAVTPGVLSTAPMQPMFLYLPYQAVHSGNKPTELHPEYELNEAPQEYIDQVLYRLILYMLCNRTLYILERSTLILYILVHYVYSYTHSTPGSRLRAGGTSAQWWL